MRIRHLTAAVILLAITSVMLWHMYRHVSTLRTGASSGDDHPQAIAVPFDMAVPSNEERAATEPPAEPENDASAHLSVSGKSHVPTASFPEKTPPAKRRAPAPTADLSRYKVRAKRTASGDYLPEDDSMTLAQVRENVNHHDDDGHDWGRGVVGDVIRGAQKVVKQADDATLDASRKALGTMASPDSAKIRPDSDGVRLHINIPTK